MFTGIIEVLGKIEKIEKEGSNYHYTISSSISKELKVDQSVSHNGVCLTVVALSENTHTVTAIDETLNKTNLGDWEIGQIVNLERAMLPTHRLDGHMVQGHVDQTARCIMINENDGSWEYRFSYKPIEEILTVEKGSVCVNGVSLTLVNVEKGAFSVAIIPYTYEHTNFHQFQEGSIVNLEFDVIGKYVAKMMQAYVPAAK